MRALQFSAFGDPSTQLSVVKLSDPVERPYWAIVRVLAASVNPSDVKNVTGHMEGTVLPRVPGRDFSGIVEQGPEDWQGCEVWGSGGDVGFTLDGSHAELIAVPVASLSRKPSTVSHEEAASIGLTFVIGWVGLVQCAELQAGETVAIVGVSGGVGGAVAQLARALGAGRVVGIDRHPPPEASPARVCLDEYVPVSEEVADEVRSALDGHGAKIVFDTVGGVMFASALSCLSHRGRLIEISATGQRRVEFDLLDFYHNESRLFGADSRKLSIAQSAPILDGMRALFEEKKLKPPLIGEVLPLERGVEAYRSVASSVHARVVLKP